MLHQTKPYGVHMAYQLSREERIKIHQRGMAYSTVEVGGMSVDYFKEIYCVYKACTGKQLLYLESHFGYRDEDYVCSADFIIGEGVKCRSLFDKEGGSYIVKLFFATMLAMGGRSIDEAEDFLDVLEFIQYLGARALWKFHCPLPKELENLVRDFDRTGFGEERASVFISAEAQCLCWSVNQLLWSSDA